MKDIDSIVFDSFNKLTSNDEKDRIFAGVQLLQHLSNQKDIEKQNKENEYALKRLIRGVGASTTQSRAGFFTTLVAFLQTTNNLIPITKILEITKKELKVGTIIGNKEDADAIVGKILTCGAILRTNNIIEVSSQDIDNILQMLLETTNYRTYHKSLAYSFIVELLQKITQEQFIESVWPLLEPQLKTPWSNHNINTIHCLIVAKEKFPNILTNKYMKLNFGDSELLNPDSYKSLLKIFWDNTNVNIVAQPGFEYFAKYIANSKNLIEFWTKNINTFLGSNKNVSKIVEIKTLKILTDILLNSNLNNINISLLFTENLIKMITTSLKSIKPKKDITLKAFYDDLFDSLLICCNKMNNNDDNDNEKINIIKKLILYPGILNIEKFTTNRIIHQIIVNLNENDIKELFNIYKNIFLNKIQKNPYDKMDQWLNIERQNAGYMLQTLITHKSIQISYEWRLEQLKFFMILGLFNTNENFDIIKHNDNDDDIEWLGNDFTEQMKQIFYTCLQSKMNKLNDEKNILFQLVEFCNEILQRKQFNKYLKNKIHDDKIIKAWQEMYNEIIIIKKKKSSSSSTNKKDKLQLVFHILLLHMGLQLFREPDMAEAAILDLEKCMKNIKIRKTKINLNENNININNEEEPEWIEVVIDLFLHLLSQNTSALRNIVNSVFPHLCDSLTLTAVHQILSVLEMKDGYNPLSDNNSEENNDDDDDNESEKSENDSKDDDNNNDESSDDDDDDEEEDDDDDEEEDDEDEEIMDEKEEESANETDKLRNAISIALGTIGKDIDQESVDLDDLNDEDGEKLDEALSEAFKAMRKTTDTNKRSKVYRIKKTTIMHFRIRVLDLIEIYLQNNPNLLITLEILINLFNMIEYCTDDDLKPLSIKIDKVLNKLTQLKQFSNIDDVTEKNICNYLRLIIEKKIRSSSFEAHNKIRSKCCHFLIINSKQLTENNELIEISKLLNEYLNDFIKSRNPIINITLLTDIFQMRWQYIWNLAIKLTENGLNETTRTYRRIQIIELLENLYKNHKLIEENMKLSKKSFKLIENNLMKHIKYLNNLKQISNREYLTILLLLITINRCHNKIQLNMNFDHNELCNLIQDIRKKIKLDTTQNYIRFCNIFKLKIIKNSDVILPTNITTILENGSCQIEICDENNEIDNTNKNDNNKRNNIKENSEKKLNGNNNDVDVIKMKKRKNSTNQNDLRKEKKLKKEERLKESSIGLNGGLSFTGAPIDVNISDFSDNNNNNEPESSDDSD